MKKYLILASAALIALAACNTEPLVAPDIQEGTTTFLTFTSARPQLDVDTKTAWDSETSSIVWSSTDKIKVGFTFNNAWWAQTAAYSSENDSPNNHIKFYLSDEVVIDDSSANVGTFVVPTSGGKFTGPEIEGDFVFYAVYPGALVDNSLDTAPSANIKLNASQTPAVGSFDATTDVMVGTSDVITSTGLPDSAIELNWNRVVAHVALTFSNMNFGGTETPSKITLTFNEDAKVAGSFSVNISDGTIGTGSANEIVLEGSGLVVDGSSITTWATVLPVTFTSLDVEIKTDKAIYTRSITGLNLTFKKNARNTLTINMTTADREAQAEYEWVKKDITAITSSDVFVIVGNNGSNYAMSNGNGASSAPSAIAVTVADDKLSVAPAESIQWTLSVSDGNYTFYPYGSTTTWLYCTNNNNGLRVGTGGDKAFTISDGYLYNNGQSRYIGVYNSTDWRSYTSINNNIKDQTFSFYVKSAADTREDAELSFATTSFEANIGDDFTAPTLTNPHSLTVTYSSSDENLALVDENTGEVVIGNDEGTVTITATFAGDEDYKPGTASYTITISDPNATGNDGSLAHPYTVAEALAAAGELATGGQSDDEVYISGIISTVSSYYSTYKSITYYISDDGTTSGQFEVYSGKGLEGADFSAITDLAVGDEVTVKGYLKNYSGTLEVYQNNQIVAINYATRYTITVNSATNGTITASAASAGAQGLITLTATPNSGYELDEWIVKDASDNDVTVTNNQFTMPASNVTVTASFTEASGSTETYRHVFNAKPTTGNNISLSEVKWNIQATNLGNYNSGNYAGVQIGTSNKNGSITLTTPSSWSYNGKSKITEVRLWLNLGGTSVTPSVTIGGKDATSDGTPVVKNSSAGSDWTKTTKVTFTPSTGGDTGAVIVNVSTVKAGYICAIEIDCE